MKEHLSGLLEGNSSAMARLERDNENLEGQVDQLTISLVDATSKKSETDKRLRQYQQVCLHARLYLSFSASSSLYLCIQVEPDTYCTVYCSGRHGRP